MVKRIKSLEANLENTQRTVLDQLTSNKSDLANQLLLEGYLIHMKNIRSMAKDVINQKGYSQESLNDFFKKIDSSVENVIEKVPDYILKEVISDYDKYNIS